jgi:protein gp37
MSTTSRIEWTQTTWNPVTGCDRISPGCQHCYALTLAGRLQAMGQAKYQTEGDPRTSGPGFGVAVHPQALIEPLRWGRPRLVFVNSMSDLFHARVPDAFIAQVFAVMAATGHHTYQVLTKRPVRMARLLDATAFVQTVFDLAAKHHGADVLTWPMPNLWVGTSVETQQFADQRIPKLLKTPAATRFLSCEPLLGPLDLRPWLPPARSTCTRADGPLTDADRQAVATFRHQLRRMAGRPAIDWVIAGGESGPGARPMRLDWVRTLRDQAADAGVAFFCKQLGSCWARDQHADPKGGDWTRWPTDLRVRAWPPVSQGDAR